MGRGDKKSKKGKIWKGSYGNSRLKKKIKERLRRLASVSAKKQLQEEAPKKPRTPRKTTRKKDVSES